MSRLPAHPARWIDPEQFDLDDGGRLQEISVILTDDRRRRPTISRRDRALRADSARARVRAARARRAGRPQRSTPMTVKTPAPPPLPDELERLLHRLRLPYVRRAAPDVIATATSQRWEHAEVLAVLLAEEAAGRDQATIRTRRRASGLPAGKTFDAWEPDRLRDPAADPAGAPDAGMDRPRRSPRASAARAGPARATSSKRSGTSRSTRAAPSPGTHPRRSRNCLRRHRVDDSVNKAISKLIRVDLVVIDDVGLLPISTDAAEALFRVVDAAYEKRSIAISSNIHPSGFDELMPKSLATATVDRLLHHAHVLITKGTQAHIA